MFTGYNWVGILLWIIVICYLIWVIHFIRVKQLMLIIKTQKAFDWKHFLTYLGMLIVAFVLLGTMSWLSFFREVDVTSHQDVDITTEYHRLELNQIKNGYYYVTAQKSKSGKQPVISYTYLTDGSKTTISSRNGTVSRGSKAINMEASVYPWNKTKIAEQDAKTGHAFSAEMTIRNKKNLLNGLGVRSGRVAGYYTLLRIPSSDFIYQEISK